MPGRGSPQNLRNFEAISLRLEPLAVVNAEQPLKADIGVMHRRVSFGPEADISAGHSMTTSARMRNAWEIASPSALAVFRFTTSSILVGSSTGRSAGFAPLRILSM